MADPIPQPLKIPEVSRFLNRANQLRAFKPAIAYWCEYHAVNQIVGKSLHTGDDDCFLFTKTLLERLEATKAERADEDAIMDNTAGQAYVEQFAQETFDRAERALRANKVTRQTADTFDAAATFFDVTHEWGTPEPETLQKIKFAKWNAARILKAIREGKDPNESNPKPREPEPEIALDPTDPAVQELTNAAPQAAYVEDVPDAGEPLRQEATPITGFPPSPLRAEDGYFPPGQPAAQAPEPFIPSPLSSPVLAMSGTSPPAQASITQIPPQPSPQIPTTIPQQITPQPPPPPPPPTTMNPSAPSNWTPTHSQPPPAPSPQAPAAAPIQNLGGGGGRLVTDQKSINQAQKHAKWAISALNFEDVPTAVQELRNALATLGAL